MVIVDTSVWIDFLRIGDSRVNQWIAADLILQHPSVTAEIGMGSFPSVEERTQIIDLLQSFEQIDVADSHAFHRLVGDRQLFGTGIGFVDAQLLQACALQPLAQLATRDRRLIEQAHRLKIKLI